MRIIEDEIRLMKKYKKAYQRTKTAVLNNYIESITGYELTRAAYASVLKTMANIEIILNLPKPKSPAIKVVPQVKFYQIKFGEVAIYKYDGFDCYVMALPWVKKQISPEYTAEYNAVIIGGELSGKLIEIKGSAQVERFDNE